MRIIYGVNPVVEALRSSRDSIDRIMIADTRSGKTEELKKAARDRGVQVFTAPRFELDKLARTTEHQGIIAYIRGEFSYKDIEDLVSEWKRTGERGFFLILDSIQDPNNLGAIIRTAYAAGVHGLIIPKDRACEVTPAVAKSSAGATEHVMIARETNLVRAIERIKEENVWAAAIEAGCKDDIYSADLTTDIALVIGSEGKGIRRLVKESCDLFLSIPMAGDFNSLNAAQAAAVAMFEARRQRTRGKGASKN